MNKKNVTTCKSLESYEKKYKNRKHRLLKYSKKDVDAFDKSNNTKGFLLKDRKWVLIKDTYYEIPKAPRLTWFRNLSAGVQASVCLLGAGIVATAITVPTVLLNMNKGDHVTPTPVVDREVVIDEDCKDAISYKNMKITDDGLECVITPNSDKVTLQDDIVVKIDELILNKDVDYTYDYKTGALLIKKSTLDEHKGKIVISPLYAEKVDEEVVAAEITQNNYVLQACAAEHYQYSLSAYAVTSSSGNSMSAVSTNNYYDDVAEEYKTDLTIRDDDTGDEYTVTTVGGIAGDDFEYFYYNLVNRYDEEHVSTNMVGGCGFGGSAVTAYDLNTGDLAEQYLFGQNGLYGMQNDSTDNQLLTFWVDSNAVREAIEDINEFKDIFIIDDSVPSKSSGIGIKQSGALKTSGLETLAIPEKVLVDDKETNIEIIGDFSGLKNINTVYLPSTVKTIWDKAFEGSTSISSVIFANNSVLEEIKANAFFETDIYTIEIPKKVKNISQGAFNGCYKLDTVYFENKTGWKTKEDMKDVDVNDPYVNANQLKDVTVQTSWCYKGLFIPEKSTGIDLGYDYNRMCFIKDNLQNVIKAGKTYNIVADFNGLTEAQPISNCVFYENTAEENPIKLAKIIDTNDIQCTYYKTDGSPETLFPVIGGVDEDKIYFNEDLGAGYTEYNDGKIVLTVKINSDLEPQSIKSVVFSGNN